VTTFFEEEYNEENQATIEDYIQEEI